MFNIDYDSRCEYQSSNYPFRIIRYTYNSKCGCLKFYKKQKEYYFDDVQIEKYIKNKKEYKTSKLINKISSYKSILDLNDKFIGDERIVNYTLNKHVFELHFDRSDKEYYFDDNEIKNYIMKVNID